MVVVLFILSRSIHDLGLNSFLTLSCAHKEEMSGGGGGGFGLFII